MRHKQQLFSFFNQLDVASFCVADGSAIFLASLHSIGQRRYQRPSFKIRATPAICKCAISILSEKNDADLALGCFKSLFSSTAPIRQCMALLNPSTQMVILRDPQVRRCPANRRQPIGDQVTTSS